MPTVDSDDWGLLSVADVFDTDFEPKKKMSEDFSATQLLNEFVFPFFCGSSSSLASSFTEQLAAALKAECGSRCGTIEELYQNRSRKMQHSLTTSKQIRQRLSDTTGFLTSSISQNGTRAMCFDTISLLGTSLKNSDSDSYLDIFLDSVKRIDWSTSSNESCLEVLKALHEHLDDSKSSTLKQSVLRGWKMTLALHSGSLSAMIRCLLDGKSCTALHENYKPPVLRTKLDVVDSSIDSFLTRNYRFPFSIETVKISCLPNDTYLSVCCGNSISLLESLGKMGTRLQKKEEHTFNLQKKESFVSLRNNVVLVTKFLKFEDMRFIQIFREFSMETGLELRRGSVVINCSEIQTRNTRVFFTSCEGEIFCLVISLTLNAPKRKIFIIPHIQLEKIFSPQNNEYEVFLRETDHILLRNPVHRQTNRALHFTKASCVSVGCVSLKDRFSPFCVEFWAFPRNGSENQTILSIGKKQVEEIFIEIQSSELGIEWRGGSRTPYLSPSFTTYISPGKLALNGRWWHVALNFTGTSWELWLNDRFVSRSPALVSSEPVRDAQINLGKSFVGFLSEVRIWSVARSATELHRDAHRRLLPNESCLISYYPLNENFGDLLVDYSRDSEHALLSHQKASWYTVPYLPIIQEEERLIPDFIPINQCDEENPLFFAVTPHFFCVASCVSSQGNAAMILFQYNRKSRVLISQMRIDLGNAYRLKGIAYNPMKSSLLCWAATVSNTQQLTLFDVHNQSCLPFSSDRNYKSIWDCGRDVCSHASTYALKFVNAERYLADQSSWTTTLPDFTIDLREDLVSLLVALIKKSLAQKDYKLAQDGCVLLHANLFFRHEVSLSKLLQEVGQPFSSVTELLDTIQKSSSSCLRDDITQIAFMSFAKDTQLLRMCCQCFLPSRLQIGFLNTVTGRTRSAAEEGLLLSLLEYYSTLQACNDVLVEGDLAKILYTSLIRESVFQVDRCLTAKSSLALQRTSRCLEVFQEILFVKITENESVSTDLSSLGMDYTSTLLRACGKTIEAIVKALRKAPQAEKILLNCLERSHVGALLPSFSLSLPSLPINVLDACPQFVQSCRETLSSLLSAVTVKAKWISDLGIALTFSLALISCSLLNGESKETKSVEDEGPAYLDLLRGGKRKAGSERDVLIKNLQQGVGTISKTFEELQKKDRTALRVMRDESLARMERNVMAAFCALTISTRDLKEASASSLEPAFNHVLKMRPWVLAKRQESKVYVGQVESRAVYLSQFECCCKGGPDVVTDRLVPKRKDLGSSHHRWKQFFHNWKVMKIQRTLSSSQEETSISEVCKRITEFVQSDLSPKEPEELVARRGKKARYRLSGLLLMKQLVEEARVSTVLAGILLPVFAKSLCGWHYSDGVDCCSSEDVSRLHGAYFQMFNSVLGKFLDEADVVQREPWAILLCALFTADLRRVDFRHFREDICPAFRGLWASDARTGNYPRWSNGLIPPAVRETKLSAEMTAQSMVIGESERCIKSQGGRGTCVAPCTWRFAEKGQTFYFEVYVVDMLPGTSCSIGVGPRDYSLTRLPGWDPCSFALQSDEGVWTVTGRMHGYTFRMGDVVGCGWDVVTGEVFWTKNGSFLVATEAKQRELNPLIGFDGTGIATINFGMEPFRYNPLLNRQMTPAPLHISSEAWDAFRIFSIRAAVCLELSVSSGSDLSSPSIQNIAGCVKHCFTALRHELVDTVVNKPLSASSDVRKYLSHSSTLAQLLVSVPTSVVAPCVQSMVEAVEHAASAFLVSPCSSSSTFSMVLLTWFDCIHLCPPTSPIRLFDTVSSDAVPQPHGVRRLGFLETLIRLASRLFYTPFGDKEREDTFFYLPDDLGRHGEEVSSMALRLLQRVNAVHGGDVSATGEKSPSGRTKGSAIAEGPQKQHSWGDVLHQWVLSTLRHSNSDPICSTHIMLALAVLGGSPRYASAGDTIFVRSSPQCVTIGCLLSYSLSEEICEIIGDDQKCIKVPLRLCDLIIPDDSECYFPTPSCERHKVQVKAVLSLALRCLEAGKEKSLSPGGSMLYAQLFSILLRCVQREIQLPNKLLTFLHSFSSNGAPETPIDITELRAERVMADWRCATALQTAPNLLDGLSDVDLHYSEEEEMVNPESSRAEDPSPRSGGSDEDGPRAEHLDLGHMRSGSGHSVMLLGRSGHRNSLNHRFVHDGMNELIENDDGEDEEIEEEESEDESDEEVGEESTESEEINQMAYMTDMEASGSDENGEEREDRDFLEQDWPSDEGSYITHFERGCLCISSQKPVGNNFTLEMHIRPTNIRHHQILLLQELGMNEAQAHQQYLMARIHANHIEFGIIECTGSGRSTTSSMFRDANDMWMCKSCLLSDDPGRFVSVTLVQFGCTLSLYNEGILQDTKKVPVASSLLEKDLFLGGTVNDPSSYFVGDMKGVRVYEIALEPSMVDQLSSLHSFLSMVVDSRLCIKLGVKRKRFFNACKTSAVIPAVITPIGDVGFLEHASVERLGSKVAPCARELDFSYEAEERDFFTYGELQATTLACNTALLWKRREGQGTVMALNARSKMCKQLMEFYSIAIFTEALYRNEALIPPTPLRWSSQLGCTSAPPFSRPTALPPTRTPSLDHFNLGELSLDEETIRRILSYTLQSCNDYLYDVLGKTLRNVAVTLTREVSTETEDVKAASYVKMLGNEALQHLLQVAQREQVIRVYESTHPYRQIKSTTHGVVMHQRYYQLFFDARCVSSDVSFSFATDQNMLHELVQLQGFALSPFAITLPQFYFNVRSDSEEPQWGYKVYVVFECRPQLLAMRLFRSMLTCYLEKAQNLSAIPFLISRDCLSQLNSLARLHTGKTRRLALSCLTDLLLHAEWFSLRPQAFSTLHDIRRMTERRYRKYLSGQTVHSRFLQVVAECYVTYRDAHYCWMEGRTSMKDRLLGSGDEGATEMEEVPSEAENEAAVKDFRLHRQQQRMLYADRDCEEQVRLYLVQEPQNVQIEWTGERICVVKSDSAGGTLVASTALKTGTWYYELRVGGVGDGYIGVLPTRGSWPTNQKHGSSSCSPHNLYAEGLTDCMLQPVAYNGRGIRYGMESELLPVSVPNNAWRQNDYLGIVLNISARTCTIYVNGEESDICFSFLELHELNGDEATDTDEISFCPYFALDGAETFFFNFGGYHYVFEPPHGPLPLDPINFTLGTLLPYNQIRAFHDLSAHLLTGGKHPMPLFCYEDPDPFAGSTERSGPVRVSLLEVEGAEVSALDVRTTSTQFCTVIADCSVSGGAWYFEVTLRSQGLMQIGWAVKSELQGGSVGDMPSSWSIDLFRQVKWFNGKSEPISHLRHWTVGDVIGCALDLHARELNFYFNGRKVGNGTATFRFLPIGVEYVPGISMRAGNHVTFNFGSSPFQYKPDGFQALGVPDSWCERMDTYYANERTSMTLRRQRILRKLWQQEGILAGSNDAFFSTQQRIVKAVDAFCAETGKNYSQMNASVLNEYLEKLDGDQKQESIPDADSHLRLHHALGRVCLVILPFLSLNTQHITATTKLFLQIRTLLFRNVRTSLVGAMLRETNVRVELLRLSVNRRRARNHKGNPRNTMFGQTLSLLGDRHPRMFQTNKRMWSTVFLGEGADDIGGPYRELLNGICEELMSSALPFFVPTANNTHNTGSYRDAFVPSAKATTSYDMAAFTLVGRLMGAAMRSDEPLGLFFPPLVWKYLCFLPITEEDITDVDAICLQCVEELRQLSKEKESAELFSSVLDAEFVTRLSDQSLKELIPGGSEVKVTAERCEEYTRLLIDARIHEFDVQLQQMREGLLSVVPEIAVLLFSPAELEQKICGKADYSVDDLRKGAIYDGVTVGDRRVKLLWKALEDATPLQRRLFLRFVSGRERLPVKLRVMPLVTTGDPDEKLPQAATCFFAIELPDYSSLKIMKQKLYYSVENCMDMDKDFFTQVADESEGPRIVVRPDDRQDEGVRPAEE